MPEHFRNALLDIITGPFTSTNGLMWSAYKEHLRNIDPKELPEKIQPLFLELREIFESRFNAALKYRKESWAAAELRTNGNGYSWWNSPAARAAHLGGSWYNKDRKPNDQEIYGMVLDSDLMHNTQHPTAKRIKELIFEIVEKMPKRKSKNAKENKAARIIGNEELRGVSEEKVEF